MSDYKLDPNKNIDVSEILKDLENYRPRRRGWTWREPAQAFEGFRPTAAGALF